MSGIVFYKSKEIKEVIDFYTKQVKAEIWLDQGKCIILRHDNFLFGFCEGERADKEGIITFFYSSRGEVDSIYKDLAGSAEHSPRENPQFRIYHFFAVDPEGRKIEFQTFLHPLREYMTGSNLLLYRRSIRTFSQEEVSDELIRKILELCRYAPTSRNSQSYYYVITGDTDKIRALSNIRDQASAPLAGAPLVIAVCAAVEKTKRPQQDACIAAYHLLLAAAQHGLGTCWITDMDRPEVKELLSIPQEDYVACLTPLGYPLSYELELPERRDVKEIFRFV